MVTVAGALLLAPMSASGATTIGQNVVSGASCPADITAMQFADTSPELTYEVPAPGGVITSWSYLAAGGSDVVKFELFRRTGPTTHTVVFANTQTMIPGRVNNFPIRTAAQAGDVIGIHVGPAGTTCVENVAPTGNEIGGCMICDPALGATFTTTSLQDQVRLNVAAVVEPDCDSDGAGDESQDSNTAACPPAPEAVITKGPRDKVKTKKKRAKVTFKFDSNELGSTFNCVLDDKQEFRTCTSPLTVRVKAGKHKFSVTATDPGGNTGAAASDGWKVKKKMQK